MPFFLKLSVLGRTALFFILPLLVLGWTSIKLTAGFSLHFGLLVLLVLVALSFIRREGLQTTKSILMTLLVLFLVGGTGWFLSPFFFLLYLVPIYLGVLYNAAVSFGFLAALLVIFSSSVGEVDVSYDIMTLLSLLLVIPLVIYLRKRYLILRQTDKDILILQDDTGIKDTNTITRLLSNRITNLGVTVRQPLTFIRQAATVLLEEDLTEKEATTFIQRIRTTSTETLEHVRKFEGDTSANEVLTNKPHGHVKESKA